MSISSVVTGAGVGPLRRVLRRPGVALSVLTVTVAVACWAPRWPPYSAYHQWRLAQGSVHHTRQVEVDTGRSNTTYNVATVGNQSHALTANSSHLHIVSGDYLTMRCERVSNSPTPSAFKCRVSADSPNPSAAATLATPGLTGPPH